MSAHCCRYCCHCVYTPDEIAVCEHDDVQRSFPDGIPYKFKRPNKCPYFLFNEIAANFFGDYRKVYRPRRKSPFIQLKLFDFPTDKQRARMEDQP